MDKIDELGASNIDKTPIEIKHANLTRLNDSIFKSLCPTCENGCLLVCRDKHFHLMAKDRCVLCGQQYIYTDISDLRSKVGEGNY